MKTVKFILRLLIAIFIGLPILPILLIPYSCAGMIFIPAVAGVFQFIYGFLMDDKEIIEESKMSFSCLFILIIPFLLWYHFIKGNIPDDLKI